MTETNKEMMTQFIQELISQYKPPIDSNKKSGFENKNDRISKFLKQYDKMKDTVSQKIESMTSSNPNGLERVELQKLAIQLLGEFYATVLNSY